MTTLALPTLSRTAPSNILFSLIPNTMSFESPLNRAIQTLELPGARWQATFGWNNLSAADARILKAWLNKLSGMAGRFYLHDSSHATPAGTALGTPLVKGASQTGRTLITDGWTANQTNLLVPGDYFSVGAQLFVITEPAASDGSGNATLTFEAPLRSSPADNAPLTTASPSCVMRLVDDMQDRFQFEPGAINVQTVTIECMEAF
jgi:hypothetical protein